MKILYDATNSLAPIPMVQVLGGSCDISATPVPDPKEMLRLSGSVKFVYLLILIWFGADSAQLSRVKYNI